MHDKKPDGPSEADTVLRLLNLEKSFGSVHAVKEMDLAVARNRLVTLLGPSGCGKTTTLRMIAGFEFPTRGRIIINGTDVTDLPPNKRDIGLVFQNYSLFPHMRVFDNIAYGLKRRGVPGDERRERVRDVLELMDIRPMADRFPSELSGGQQQRVALARAIVIRPKILLLDEPLSALDAKLRQRMRFEIRELQRQIGITAILVTHDQEEALAMSDDIVVMNNGVVVQTGSPAAIYADPQTSFVAGFVGETNMFKGAVKEVDESQRRITVETDRGFRATVATHTHGYSAGQQVLICIRPETISLQRGKEAPRLDGMTGTISGASYLGARTLVHVDTPEGEVLVSLPNDAGTSVRSMNELLSPDGPVTLSWPAGSCHVIQET